MTKFKQLVEMLDIFIEPSTADSACKDFLHQLTSESDQEVFNFIEKLNTDSVKKWYNGSREMTGTIADYIYKHLDKSKIINSINLESIHVRQELVQHFAPYSDCLTTKNVGIHAYIITKTIFKNIIDGIDTPLDINYETLINAQPIYSNMNNNYGPALYQEAQGNCPKCGDSLYVESSSGISTWNYQVTLIDSSLDKSKDNLICLCRNCFKKYSLGVDNYDLDDIKKAKASISTKTRAYNKISNIQIDTDIREIIYSLEDFDISEIDELNFEPVAVKDKLSDTPQLMIKVQAYAAYYYPFISDTLKELADDDIIDIDALEGAIKHSYGNLAKSFDKSTIFNTLVDWLVNRSHKTRENCEIIISYFVQDCEVFHAISK